LIAGNLLRSIAERLSMGRTGHLKGASYMPADALGQLSDQQKTDAVNQRIFETSLDLIMVVDRAGTFIRLSPSSHAILGYHPDELIGRSAAEILYPEDLDSTRGEMRAARRGRVTRNFRCRYVHKDGHIVALTWMGVWSDPEQQYFFIGRDMTEAEEAARLMSDIQAARDAAVNANLAKSRFLATASHDLRQPLHAMNLFISALRRRVSGDEAMQLVDGMASATTSMQAMFNSVLDVTKLEAGAVTPAFADIAVEPVLARLRASFDGPAEAKGLALDIPTTDAQVHSDPVLLESVLRNLLSNAVRYTRQGDVNLTCETIDGVVRIEVCDTGVGIPADEQERIFEEFHRLSSAGSAERGLGLGLAIVRRLADLLEIGIELTSEVGIGSVFALTVPLAISAAEAEVAPREIVNPLIGRRLLLVEDDALVRDALRREVIDWGAVPLIASSVDEALALLAHSDPPELAIVDRDLGGKLDGPGLLDLLRERFQLTIPAVIVTGATDPDALTALRNSGYQWVTKPIDAGVLERTVGKLLQRDNPT
jgi:PAS domain S-box-containing protein